MLLKHKVLKDRIGVIEKEMQKSENDNKEKTNVITQAGVN
jgi:hypothetical protein